MRRRPLGDPAHLQCRISVALIPEARRRGNVLSAQGDNLDDATLRGAGGAPARRRVREGELKINAAGDDAVAVD